MSDNSRAARAIKVATQCVLVAMIAVAAAEAAVALFFTIRDGEFVSPRDRLTRSPNTFVNAMAEGTNCRYVDTLYPDPYLAHVHFQPPGCKHSYNRIGLEGADIPFVRDPAHFTILLTGGSVAAQVAGVKWRGAREADPVNDTTFLQDELNRCYKPLHGSSFVVLNGADGAWKQPQQAIMTLIYGDVADAVVTLDGFNEHYALDSVRLEMPSGNFAAVNPTATGSYSALASAWVANELIKYVENNWLLSRSFLAYALISATRNGLSAYADDPHISAISDARSSCLRNGLASNGLPII